MCLQRSGAGGQAMHEPARGLKSSLLSSTSYLKRIQDNLRSLHALTRVRTAAPATGGPIHLLDENRTKVNSAAQFGSTLAHILVCVVLLFSALQPVTKKYGPLQHAASGPFTLPVPKWLQDSERVSLGRRGDSGGRDSLPPSGGTLPQPAREALVAIHLPDGRPHLLNAPVAVVDPEAPEFPRQASDPGLPWMKKNNSEGSGKNGIGPGDHDGMGMGPGDGTGTSDQGAPYANVVSQVVCRICPDPLYTDEARKQKLQGTVMMRVLVGADGRVENVQITRGLGLGLDESAVSTVRGWQFSPAKDATRRPVASWITVETVFRLY